MVVSSSSWPGSPRTTWSTWSVTRNMVTIETFYIWSRIHTWSSWIYCRTVGLFYIGEYARWCWWSTFGKHLNFCRLESLVFPMWNHGSYWWVEVVVEESEFSKLVWLAVLLPLGECNQPQWNLHAMARNQKSSQVENEEKWQTRVKRSSKIKTWDMENWTVWILVIMKLSRSDYARRNIHSLALALCTVDTWRSCWKAVQDEQW